MTKFLTCTAIAVVGLHIAACSETEVPSPVQSATAADAPEPAAAMQDVTAYSPAVGREYPTDVYFGDTHLHTSVSLDSYGDGNTMVGPDEAYRFAKGEEVTASFGVRARLLRPLDFLVVADHAENLGLAPMVAEPNPDLLKTEFGRHHLILLSLHFQIG